MKKIIVAALAASLLAPHAIVLANDASPVGLWKTIDDKSGKPRSLVRISESNGVLSGKIEKLFKEPGEDTNPKCDKCEDERKDQPIIGMTFLKGLKKEGSEYTGGEILDPNNGKIYRSKLTLIEDGKKLNVRGYVGAPMFGRTQVWVRAE